MSNNPAVFLVPILVMAYWAAIVIEAREPGSGGLGRLRLSVGQQLAQAIFATPYESLGRLVECQTDRMQQLSRLRRLTPATQAKVKLACFTGEEDKSECCVREGMASKCLPLCDGRYMANKDPLDLDASELKGCLRNHPHVLNACLMNTKAIRSRFDEHAQRAVRLAVGKLHRIRSSISDICTRGFCHSDCEALCVVEADLVCIGSPDKEICEMVFLYECMAQCNFGCHCVV